MLALHCRDAVLPMGQKTVLPHELAEHTLLAVCCVPEAEMVPTGQGLKRAPPPEHQPPAGHCTPDTLADPMLHRAPDTHGTGRVLATSFDTHA